MKYNCTYLFASQTYISVTADCVYLKLDKVNNSYNLIKIRWLLYFLFLFFIGDTQTSQKKTQKKRIQQPYNFN